MVDKVEGGGGLKVFVKNFNRKGLIDKIIKSFKIKVDYILQIKGEFKMIGN